MGRYFAIRRLALTVTDWTPVVTPIHASGFTIRNAGVSALLCRDDSDLTDDIERVAAGASYNIQSVVATFDPLTTVCWLQSANGPGIAVVSFVR